MNRPAGLNSVASALADLLERVYPNWTDRTWVTWRMVGRGTLEVRVPSPCNQEDGDLVVHSDGPEVTVAFTKWWHRHYDFDPGAKHFSVNAVQLCRWLDAFLDDREVIVTLFEDGRWVSSMSLGIGYGSVISPKTRDEIGRFIFKHQNTTSYVVRSWSGGLDEEHPVTPGGWGKE